MKQNCTKNQVFSAPGSLQNNDTRIFRPFRKQRFLLAFCGTMLSEQIFIENWVRRRQENVQHVSTARSLMKRISRKSSDVRTRETENCTLRVTRVRSSESLKTLRLYTYSYAKGTLLSVLRKVIRCFCSLVVMAVAMRRRCGMLRSLLQENQSSVTIQAQQSHEHVMLCKRSGCGIRHTKTRNEVQDSCASVT